MSKRIVAVTAVILCLALAAAGCQSKSEEEVKLFDFDLSGYVMLGKYIGLNADSAKNDRMWFDIRRELVGAGFAHESASGVVEVGDMVNIDFVGKRDGVPFAGGSAEGIDLLIGSGEFIPGFEEGLIGERVGILAILELTFPENYHAADLAGQDVIFEVGINSIKQPEPVAFKKEVLWELAKRNSVVMRYPEKEFNAVLSEIENYYADYAASMGLSWSDFLEQVGSTQAEVDETFREMAEQKLAGDMIACAIARQEGLDLSEEEYKDVLSKYLLSMGYESEKAYKDANQGMTIEQAIGKSAIELYFLFERVIDFIYENAAS